jgi:hypothetical protein
VLPNPERCVSSETKPVVLSGGIETLSPSTGAVAGWLLYAVVDQRVSLLRTPDGDTLRPVSNRLLPMGLRAAVTLSARPRHFAPGIVRLAPVNPRGHGLVARDSPLKVLATRSVSPAHAPTSGCRIRARALPGLRLLRAETLVSAPAAWRGVGYLSCYSLTVRYENSSATAALLLSPSRSARQSSGLPGFLPVKGRPGVDEETISNGKGGRLNGYRGETLLARGVNGAWLVLESEARPSTALRVLDALVARS